MGCWTMEQQAALGMARALPAALHCSNDSLSANSRCLPFKAGQVNKVSPWKSINKSLFTHWLIVLIFVRARSLSLSLSLTHSRSCDTLSICLSPSLCTSAVCARRENLKDTMRQGHYVIIFIIINNFQQGQEWLLKVTHHKPVSNSASSLHQTWFL